MKMIYNTIVFEYTQKCSKKIQIQFEILSDSTRFHTDPHGIHTIPQGILQNLAESCGIHAEWCGICRMA